MYSNNKVTAPVSIYDVQRALGANNKDLGTLCQHANINKWARYKPMRYESIGEISYQTRKNAMFGLEVPYCQLIDNTAMDVMNSLVYYLNEHEDDNDAGWKYLTPRGDRTAIDNTREYFRLTDFVRNSLERTQAQSYHQGDPTPVALQGYNHAAEIPFTASLISEGVVKKEDVNGIYYEVNQMLTNDLTFRFQNSAGDDLHLQDFIDLDTVYSNNKAWRPIVQSFVDIHDNYSGTTHWYEADQAYTEECGNAITSTPSDIFDVSMDVSTSSAFGGVGGQFVNVGDAWIHVCLGVGCVNPDFSSWLSNNSLFILPYTHQQWEDCDLPFYYRIKLISNIARNARPTGLLYLNLASNIWTAATGTAPYFEVNSHVGPELHITFELNKLPSQNIDFVGEHGSAQTSGATAFKIQAIEEYNGVVKNTFYLTPSNSSWATTAYENVPTGPATDYVTLYAKLSNTSLQSLPVGGTLYYRLKGNTGGSTWTDIGMMSVTKGS